MPFRCRQKMQSYAAGAIYFEVGSPNPDTGVVEFSDVSQQFSLPDAEMTDLHACLKAGVSLEKTNCKLVTSSSVPRSLGERLNSLTEDDFKSAESKSNESNPSDEDK